MKNGSIYAVHCRKVIVTAIAGAITLMGASGSFGQEFYEASGQTSIFKLAPGEKSTTSAIRNNASMKSTMENGITIAAMKGSIVVTILSERHGSADISIYDMAGRQLYRQNGLEGRVLRLDSRKFAPGIYNARIRINGRYYSHRFVANR
jgi:hypothetical protein